MPVLAPFTQPAWPLLDYAICWAAGPNQSPVQNYWSDVTGRTEGTVQVTRGKIYELDQVQPGQATLSLRNDDSVFDPDNSGSPFWPQVLPYRLARIRAQLPGTVNLLTADQATAFYASKGSGGAGSTLPQWVGSITGSTVTVGTNAGPPSFNYYQVSAAAAFETVAFFGFSVAPGQVYTGQCEANCSTGVTAEIALRFVDVNGNVIATTGGGTTTSAGGAIITVTATAPANAAGGYLYVQNNAAVAGGAVFNVWNVQLEANSAASAWVQPGTWYSLFTGYVERWPESWTSGGAYGTVDLTLVDYFAFLAQRPMLDPFTMDLLALSPNFLYPLNETQGASVFQDVTGKRGPASPVAPGAGYTGPSVAPGDSLTSQDNNPQGSNTGALTGAFLGGAGPTLMTSMFIDTTGPEYGGAVAIPADPTTGMVGPPASGGWTRIIAARVRGVAMNNFSPTLWDYAWGSQRLSGGADPFSIYLNGYLVMGAAVASASDVGPNGQSPDYGTFPGLLQAKMAKYNSSNQLVWTDEDWHLYGVSVSSDGKTADCWCDGSQQPFSYTSTTSIRPPVGGFDGSNFDYIGAAAGQQGAPIWNFQGDIAFACELPFAVSAAQWAALYQVWRNAWGTNSQHTETSDQRYARILAWAGYTGPSSVQAGASVDYGPATDVAGKAALTALQTVVDTEAGQHFVAADGTIVFQARTNRYNPASTLAFGENAGEVPYQSAQFDFDPTRVANDIQITGTFGRAVYTASDATSQNDYGQIGLQRDVNSLDPNELQDAADYLAYQNAQPATRLEQLPVDVGSNPALWANLLPLDLGACVTVNRRPPAGTTKQVVGFLEQIVWQLADDRTCTWTAQISPAARHYFAQFDSATYGAFDSMVFGY